MATGPLVSVIMPVFNAGPYLQPAVESLFTQTCGDFELLLVDDGGTDGSGEKLRSFGDPRVRVLDHGPGRPNRGIPTSRNVGLAAARGELIAFLNHDDTSHPERLGRQVAFLRAHLDVGLLGTAITNIDARGGVINQQPFPATHLEIRWMGMLDCPVRQSAMMAWRRSFTDHDLRYDETFTYNSDYEFIERMTRHVLTANLPEVLTHYRKHQTNTSVLRYDPFVAAGNRVALAAIGHELPGFSVTLEQVAAIRSVVWGYAHLNQPRSLALTKRAWEVYLDLFHAFQEKHHLNPQVAHLQPRQQS